MYLSLNMLKIKLYRRMSNGLLTTSKAQKHIDLFKNIVRKYHKYQFTSLYHLPALDFKREKNYFNYSFVK